jgi:ankyrin repeat protein
MDRKPTYQPPPINRNPIYGRIHYPERKPNDDIVQKLFSLIEEGNIFKIKDYLLSNNLTTLVRTSAGETLLHTVIKSSNLTRANKLELATFLIERGSPVSLSDENNITPLHIACKMQLNNIVKQLILAGANVNAIDNQGMTPLHYQILSESEPCKSEKNMKVGQLVPLKIDREKINEDFKKITSEVFAIIHRDNNINRYAKHIRNTIKNLHNMYPEDIESRRNKFISDVSIVFTDPKINQNEKYNKVITSVLDLSGAIDELVANKLKDSLNKVDIQPNLVNGWGPDNNNMNKILPYKSVGSIVDRIEQYREKIRTDFLISLKKTVDSINIEMSKLDNSFDMFVGTLLSIKHVGGNQIPGPDLVRVYSGSITTGQYPNFNVHQNMPIAIFGNNDTRDALIMDAGQYGLINDGYYFISNYKYLIDQAYANLRLIEDNVNKLNEFLKSNTVYFTYDVISSNIIVYIQNIILHLIVLSNETSDEKPFLLDRLTELQKLNAAHNAPPLSGQIKKLIYNMRDEIRNIRKVISGLYIVIQGFVNQFNTVVDIINRISAIRFILQYHNGLRSGFIPEPYTNQFNNIFDRPLQRFPILPPTLIEYQKDINIHILREPPYITNAKRRIWELYLPQFTYMNFASFYTGAPNTPFTRSATSLEGTDLTTVADVRPPKIGFAISLENLNRTPFAQTQTVGAPASMPLLKYNGRTEFYQGEPNDNLIYDASSILGNMGVVHSDITGLPKENAALPSVGVVLDDHINIIKYIIIQYLITKIKLYNQNNPDASVYRELIQLIDDYKRRQSSEISLDDVNDAIIYTLVGRTTDAIFINFIRACIREASLDNALKSTKQIIDIGKSYTDIASGVTNRAEVLLLNYDPSYKLDLNEIIDSVITKFFNPFWDPKSVQLDYTAQLLNEREELDPDQHTIYNYSFSTKAYESRCYTINPDITSFLISRNARINQKDFAGNTPMYYCIELQNISAINTLISNNASVNNSLSRNLIGITPMQHALKLYRAQLSILQDTDRLSSELFKKVTTFIKRKPEYQNNILKYSENMFKQVLLMINHQFYLIMKQYKRNWTYSKHKAFLDNFRSIIDMDKPINKFIPLLQYDRSIIKDRGVKGTDVLNAKMKYVNIKISQIVTYKSEIEQQVSNLRGEQVDIQSKISDPYYRDRDLEINDLTVNLGRELSNLDDSLNKLNDLLQKLSASSQRLSVTNASTLDGRANAFVSRNINDASALYGKIFIDVVNYSGSGFKYTSDKDLITYLILWDNYIKDSSRQDNITQIHLLLIKYQYKLINDSLDNQIDIDALRRVLTNLNDLHKNIMGAFALDYEQLPNEYNSNTNYALTNVLDIITHVVRHNICTMLYSTIIKLLTKYIETTSSPNMEYFTSEQYSAYITGTVESIINIGKDESMLMKYIVGTLPKKIVKLVLNIYEGEHDPDRLITFNMLFENIINILALSKAVPITKDSIFVEQLNSYVFPYFKDNFEDFTRELKNMADNYMRYIASESKQIEIASLILNKSINEKDPQF